MLEAKDMAVKNEDQKKWNKKMKNWNSHAASILVTQYH